MFPFVYMHSWYKYIYIPFFLFSYITGNIVVSNGLCGRILAFLSFFFPGAPLFENSAILWTRLNDFYWCNNNRPFLVWYFSPILYVSLSLTFSYIFTTMMINSPTTTTTEDERKERNPVKSNKRMNKRDKQSINNPENPFLNCYVLFK